MRPGDYIFARHPEGGSNYPAKVDKVGQKWLWYTDDEGRKIRIHKRHAQLQSEWAKENKVWQG